MTRQTIKAAVTRFVLIFSIATSIGAGSVGFGGTADVAAMPTDCTRIFAVAEYYWNLYVFWDTFGYFDRAYHYLNVWDFYLTVGNGVCN